MDCRESLPRGACYSFTDEPDTWNVTLRACPMTIGAAYARAAELYT